VNRRKCEGGKYRAHQRSRRLALRGPTDRNSSDGCGSPSSVVGLGRLCDLRSLVDWFCDIAQNSPMISMTQEVHMITPGIRPSISVDRLL
jgi:hypothetical protein